MYEQICPDCGSLSECTCGLPITKPNEAPSNEQEVENIAESCGLWPKHDDIQRRFLDGADMRESLQEFASKLRAKDASTIANYEHQHELNTVEMNAMNATIAQLKEELAFKNVCLAEKGALQLTEELAQEKKLHKGAQASKNGYFQQFTEAFDNWMATQVELSATKDKMEMLMAMLKKISACKEPWLISEIDDVVYATSFEVAKYLAERDAKVLTELFSVFVPRGTDGEFCIDAKQLEDYIDELRSSANPTTTIKE